MVVLAIVVFLVYYPAARGPFIFDDAGTIVDNRSIRRLWPLVGSDASPGPLNPSETSAVHGRPLVNLSFAANHYFGELDPFGYRVVNILIHILSTVLLWSIVAETLRLEYFQGRLGRVAEPLAFGSALLWALHPLNTECVVYVTQRTELMMGMFYLATLYGSICYWNSERTWARVSCLVLTTLACLSGMLSKEMMASAPAMVLLYERTFIAGTFREALRRSWPLYLGLALTWLPVVALNLNGARTPASGFGLGVAAHEWWFTQAKVLFPVSETRDLALAARDSLRRSLPNNSQPSLALAACGRAPCGGDDRPFPASVVDGIRCDLDHCRPVTDLSYSSG